MKYHLPAFFKPFTALLLVCPLCLSQISSTGISWSGVIHAVGLTNEPPSANTSDNTTSNIYVPDSNTTSETNDTNTDGSISDSTDSETSDLSSPETTATGGAITASPKPTKKPAKKSVKKVYFSKSSVKLWPLQSNYNPLTINDKGAKYNKIT